MAYSIRWLNEKFRQDGKPIIVKRGLLVGWGAAEEYL